MGEDSTEGLREEESVGVASIEEGQKLIRNNKGCSCSLPTNSLPPMSSYSNFPRNKNKGQPIKGNEMSDKKKNKEFRTIALFLLVVIVCWCGCFREKCSI